MNATNHINKLSEHFSNSLVQVQRIEKQLIAAKEEHEKATNILGKALCPNDALVGEQFCIWVSGDIFGITGDVLVTVKCLPDNNYSIKRR